MRLITITADDRQALAHDRYHHPDPRVQRKMEVLWLKSHGLSHDRIAAYAGVSRGTVQRYLNQYWSFANWPDAAKTKPQIAILAIKMPGRTWGHPGSVDHVMMELSLRRSAASSGNAAKQGVRPSIHVSDGHPTVDGSSESLPSIDRESPLLMIHRVP